MTARDDGLPPDVYWHRPIRPRRFAVLRMFLHPRAAARAIACLAEQSSNHRSAVNVLILAHVQAWGSRPVSRD